MAIRMPRTSRDPTMLIGSTSKTWNPQADSKFWHQQSKDGGPRTGSSSVSSTKCRPDTSEGSIAVPRLGSIEELDEEALRELRLKHFRH